MTKFIFTDFNQCNPNPCNGYPCVDKINGYKCQCKDGYIGDLCQIEPDYCKDSPCKNNGTCSNSAESYTCSCKKGYKGNRCEIEIGNNLYFFSFLKQKLFLILCLLNIINIHALSKWWMESLDILYGMFCFLCCWSKIAV